MSEISSKSTRKQLRFFVDCTNGERFTLNESELKAGAALAANSDKMVSDSDALAACQKAVKSSANFPSSVDVHLFTGTSVRKGKLGVTVNMDFDAKNALGNELPYSARCVFPVEGSPEVTFSRR